MFLLNQIKNETEIREELYQHADTITQYGVVFRYPSELFLEEHDARRALEYAKGVMDWARSIISDSESKLEEERNDGESDELCENGDLTDA